MLPAKDKRKTSLGILLPALPQEGAVRQTGDLGFLQLAAVFEDIVSFREREKVEAVKAAIGDDI